jgi:hypothetical protein
VCSAVSKERVCNSCATCIAHTISHGTTQLSIHLQLVQEICAEREHLQRQESWSALCVFGLASKAAHKNQNVKSES